MHFHWSQNCCLSLSNGKKKKTNNQQLTSIYKLHNNSRSWDLRCIFSLLTMTARAGLWSGAGVTNLCYEHCKTSIFFLLLSYHQHLQFCSYFLMLGLLLNVINVWISEKTPAFFVIICYWRASDHWTFLHYTRLQLSYILCDQNKIKFIRRRSGSEHYYGKRWLVILKLEVQYV